ncbi:phospholipase D delta-like [Chenopodium quinoa]|uniref:phospholipase D delta-like n=1 Tax=Chenopodium quinoa TaxID=63459 RepID=UPI000B7957BD|nr:phospholipase D delta-like [Chenopodium quinoa]
MENEKENNHGIYLHGDLDLHIIEARCLPNMDLFSENFRRVFSSCRAPFSRRRKVSSEGKNQDPDHKLHLKNNKIITSDPYVTVNIGGATVARTRVISNSQTPKWEEHFSIPLAHAVSDIEFKIKDNDVLGADMIGTATVPASLIISGEVIDDWFPILRDNGKPPKPKAAVHLRLRFIPCDANQSNADGEHRVERSYFPARPGGRVTLYQDAHVLENDLPKIELEQGVEYQHGRCWEDICHAILEAHHLVYIVGWSVYHKVKLVREPSRPLPNGGDLSLGDLLKYKSQEGVRVLLLVWDDKTSHSKFFINTQGVMQTHDEETKKFFKHSSVICTLSPRYASSKLSIIKQQVVGTLYTHHQKCVIVDSQAPGNNRKITAFLGGLDLCDGRYDTPGHRLFRDLDTVFNDDYHNPTFEGTKGPREPWHDLHCKIEGPAAYDVLTNFEQRWRKATKSSLRRKIKSISHWHDDALLKIKRISWILSPVNCASPNDPLLWACEENDPEGWQVQVFRSIDSGSVQGFPKDVQEAESQNLVCAKNLVIDKSIQTAYIEAIRSAQHFIYIENQYFLGSSYAWPNYKNAGADHLIPMELALKVVSKIRAKERFAVYIVIPMWPEGVPTSASVQEILFWQGETMQMMYSIIAQEIKAMNLEDAHPQDYLNFYCLGNREPALVLGDSPLSSKNGEGVLPSQKYRRFMIYVHAKGMIVDDEYVILGSANINQRSMAGSRDTEIAMGAYQPHQTWGRKKRHPLGQVYGYRMSLWAEHLGGLDDLFKEAENLECVRSVNNIADENWKKFVAEDYSPLQGHLLRYPLDVDKNGKVQSLNGHEYFPDVGGKVLGAANSLPDALTT